MSSPIKLCSHILKCLLFVIGTFHPVSIHAQSLRQEMMRADSGLKDVRLIHIKKRSELFIAIRVYELHWWETFAVVRFKNHRIEKYAPMARLPDAQSIRSARQVFLKGFPYPMIEVFDMTHQ